MPATGGLARPEQWASVSVWGEVERVTKAGGSLGLNSASVRMSEESLLLTDATVSSYVAERASVIDQISPHSPLTATPIGGGNLNFAWRVSDTAGKSVFVKQASHFQHYYEREFSFIVHKKTPRAPTKPITRKPLGSTLCSYFTTTGRDLLYYYRP